MIKDEVEFAIWQTNALNAKDNNYILPVVYTFYDQLHNAIYVGSTQCIDDRLDWHRRKKYWSEVEQIGIRVYEDREQMRIAEIVYICLYHPKYNKDANYNDGKETLVFGMPGIHVTDDSQEAIFTKEELFNI